MVTVGCKVSVRMVRSENGQGGNLGSAEVLVNLRVTFEHVLRLQRG